jgi:ABC-2 type transport system ATP-binding protein
VLSLVAEVKAAGKTIVFSSHVLSEVEQVCDRVVILRAGQLVHAQPMAELRQQHRIVATLTARLPAIPEAMRERLMLVSCSETEAVLETSGELAPLLHWLATLPLAEIRIEPLGLRTIYDRFHSQHPASGRREPVGSFDPREG